MAEPGCASASPSPANRDAIVAHFGARYGAVPAVYWAPGRVNLIGDHVDYCGGPVLPMPIQFGTTVAVRLTQNDRLRGASLNVPDVIDVARADPVALPVGSWGRFLCGAVAVLAELGVEVGGVDVMVGGAIPGSGLSSSASLSVALLYALTHVDGTHIAPLQLALAAQHIEHEHVGVRCGLMDQAVIALAEPGCALRFDCFDHTHRSIPFDDASVALVVADTGKTRQLVHSAYNERRRETQRAARALHVDAQALARVAVGRLSDVDIEDDLIRRRARHVVSESARVVQAAVALESRDWAALGALLCASHASLRADYEVSCAELDALAAALAAQRGCYGARMTGAGFGGSVVALFDAAEVPSGMAGATAMYAAAFGRSPTWFEAHSLGGMRSLDG